MAAYRSHVISLVNVPPEPRPGPDGSFARSDIAAGFDHPIAVAVGDFNADGLQDLAVANHDSNTVSVLLGVGNGDFQEAPQSPIAVGTTPVWIAVGDFNGDGKPDLAVANVNSDTVSVLLGNGDGTFQAAQTFAVGDGPTSVTAGDFNRDGVQDLATGNWFSGDVSVLLGIGNRTFEQPASLPSGVSVISPVVGDFDGDGKLDLAVANFGDSDPKVGDPGNVAVLLGNGDGTFQAPQPFAVGTNPQFVAVGDFNGDRVDDLAVANFGDKTVSVLLNA